MIEKVLHEDVCSLVNQIGHADLVIGIPSYENAATIGGVVHAAAQGAAKCFPDLRTVIVNSDGGSSDATREIVEEAPIPHGIQKIVTQYQGVCGKGSALRTVFEIASSLGVRACVVVNSDLRSVMPEWVDWLVTPILHYGYDQVTPLYARHKYDGLLTHLIVYPMTRMLYGRDVRQPDGGDFGISAKLLDTYLSKAVWETHVARYGIDLWMTTTALAEGYQIAQARLGVKLHNIYEPIESIELKFVQVVGILFELMSQYASQWMHAPGFRPLPVFGAGQEAEPEQVPLDLGMLKRRCFEGIDTQRAVLREILSAPNFVAVDSLAWSTGDSLALSEGTWARIVFDFALAYRHAAAPREQLLRALVPLYCGRVVSLVKKMEELSGQAAEALVQDQAYMFEALKGELVERWQQSKDS
jgi:glycosyltransferase involved in cell wall biosynthesis